MAGPDKGSIFFMAFPAGNQSYRHRLKQVAGKALPAYMILQMSELCSHRFPKLS